MNNTPQSKRRDITSFVVVALLLILLIPNVYAVFTATDLAYSSLKQVAYLLTVAVCLLLPATILKSQAYFILEGILVLLPAPVEIASLYLNSMPASPLFLRVILRTNMREATELLVSSIPLVVALLALWVLYFVLAIKMENKWILSRRLRIAVWCALPLLAISGAVWLYSMQKDNNSDRGIAGVISLTAQKLTMKFNKIYPFDIYMALYHLNAERVERNRLAREVENFTFDITPKNDTVPEIYVLVIGEAARACNFSINGYTRSTTPCLDSTDNVVSFPYAFSSANVTEMSLPLMLTTAKGNNPEAAYTQKTVVEAIQQAGFYTAWLTNKIPFPFTLRVISAVDSSFVNSKGTDADNNYDLLLTHKMDELLSAKFSEHNPTSKMFIVLHHTGSHYKYSQRYPPQFDRFQPSLPKNAGYNAITKDNKELLVNAYDNTILYTDYCLFSVINRLKQTGCAAALVYMSDHGENLYDDDNNLVLHCSYLGSYFEFNVPFIVWYSDRYKQLYPQKTALLTSNSRKLINSDVLFHSLLDMADVPSLYLDSSLSVFSAAYKEPDSVACYTASGKQIFFKKQP